MKLYYQMKTKLLLLLLLTLQFKAFAQKEATNWYFGDKAGLNFSKGYAEALADGAMQQIEGCATISDPETGRLLFYTDGITVWNRQHQIMPNGSGLLGHYSSTQSALIVPYPNYPQRYFLFTVTSPRHEPTPSGLTYSIVNMELAGGLGDIEPTTKNTRLLSMTSEKLTAVPHANGRDYWIITHGMDNNEFYIFLLTEAGISGMNTFKIGSVYQLGKGLNEGQVGGYMKASPDGKKLACAILPAAGEPAPFELFDFDAATGTVSNAVSLGNFLELYGISFSPDNSKLYLSSVFVTQFNLSLPTLQNVINSQTVITPIPSSGYRQSLELGPDGRLYNTVGFNSFYVINYPNRAGMDCKPELVEFDFKGGSSLMGLPNFIQSYFNGLELDDEASSCDFDSAITIFPNPTDGVFTIATSAECFQIKSITIYNSIGQLCATRQINETTIEIDISKLSSGLYFVHFTTDKGNIIRKIIKM